MASLETVVPRGARSTGSPAPEIATEVRAVLASRDDVLRVRRSLFVLADLAAIWGASLLAMPLRFPFGMFRHPLHNPTTLTGHLAFLLLYSGLIVLFCNTQHLYSSSYSSSSRETLAVFKSVAMASVLLTGCIYLSGIKFISRLVIAISMLLSVAAMAGWRYIRRRRIRTAAADGLSCHNVVIVGTDRVARSVQHHLEQRRDLGFVVSGLVACDPAPKPDPHVLGTIDNLAAVCRSHFIDEVIICAHDRQAVKRAVAEARRSGVGVRLIPDLYDGMGWGTRIEYIGELPSMAIHSRKVPLLALMLKRAIDVIASAAALLLLLPLLLAIALIIKLNSKGPVLYASRRVGKKGRTFRCFKFRTMVTNAEQLKEKLQHLNERDGILFKIANDPRITKVGRVLRKYSLDELPQLLNVLKGDMSIVGPRPPLANEVAQYELEYLRRLEVAPGITGLWQVQARTNPSFDQYIALDLEYVEQWSLALDFKILLRTFTVVVAGTGQ